MILKYGRGEGGSCHPCPVFSSTVEGLNPFSYLSGAEQSHSSRQMVSDAWAGSLALQHQYQCVAALSRSHLVRLSPAENVMELPEQAVKLVLLRIRKPTIPEHLSHHPYFEQFLPCLALLIFPSLPLLLLPSHHRYTSH